MEESPTAKKYETRVIEDFEVTDVLGEGAYALVKLAKEKATGQEFAVKQLFKSQIVKENKVEAVKREKQILFKVRGHPNIVEIFYTFQDSQSLFFVLEYCPNGDLLESIGKYGGLNVNCARFYMAELVNALRCLHSQGICHRDIKPENLLIKKDFHLALTDFGTAKEIGTETRARSNSFVGTAEYAPPELLCNDPGVGLSGDLWGLGCTLYQTLVGRTPFKGPVSEEGLVSEWVIFQRIKALQYSFPTNFNLPEAKDLIERLLKLNPEERLGYGDPTLAGIKSHPFFQGIDWDALPTTSPVPFGPPETEWVFPVREEEEEGGQDGKGKDGGQSSNAAAAEDDANSQQNEKEKRLQLIQEQKQSMQPWTQFLIPNAEVIVHLGEVIKKVALSRKKRMLILTDRPRLIYIDPDRMELKGEIAWSEQISVVIVKPPRNFQIKTPKRVYVLEDLQDKAEEWMQKIHQVRDKHLKPLQFS